MNSTSITTNENKKLISKIIGYYLLNTINIVGLLLNIICVSIFFKIIKQEHNNQGHFYKYLFIKSISDCFFFIVNLPVLFYFKDDTIDKSFIMQVWYIVGYFYLFTVFSQISIWIEICALIDCLCLVSMKFQWHKSKLCFKIVTISIIMIFLVFYIPLLSKMKIEKKLNGGYRVNRTTDLMKSSIIKYFFVISRDLLPFCLSLILNLFILWFIKKSTLRRRRIGNATESSVTNQTNNLILRSINAEKNKIKMIIFTTFLHLLHFPLIFSNLNLFNVVSDSTIRQLCVVSINVYFLIPIVNYTAFNFTFRKYIRKVILFYKLFT
jgi:hypothetical protein